MFRFQREQGIYIVLCFWLAFSELVHVYLLYLIRSVWVGLGYVIYCWIFNFQYYLITYMYLYIGGFLKSIALAKIRLKTGCLTVNDRTENKESPKFHTFYPKRSQSQLYDRLNPSLLPDPPTPTAEPTHH